MHNVYVQCTYFILLLHTMSCHTHDDDDFEACSVRLTAQPGNCIKRHKVFTILKEMT